MDELQDEEDPTDVDYKPTEKEKKKDLGPYYNDKKIWWEAVEDLLKERCEEGHELHFGTLEHIYTGLVGYLLNIEARTHACRLLISRKRKARSRGSWPLSK